MSDRKTIFAWCLYDWANSAFTTLVVTFIYATYFTKTFAEDELVGTVLWSRAVGLAGLLVAVASPVLGALADRGGRRRLYLIVATLVSVTATAMLAFVPPGEPRSVLLALGLFVVANVAFEVGMVFYNAFLPQLVAVERIGRVSGYGWGLGYLGGLACMGLALLAFVGMGEAPGWMGLSSDDGWNVRATNLLVAAWFLLFSLPFFALVSEDRRVPSRTLGVLAELWQTFQEVRRFRDMARFLLARLVYNDGLVTIFAFGGIYAGITFGFTFSEVLVFGIVINLAAGLGALAFGFLDDRAGGKATILVSLVALAASVALAMAAPSRAWFCPPRLAAPFTIIREPKTAETSSSANGARIRGRDSGAYCPSPCSSTTTSKPCSIA